MSRRPDEKPKAGTRRASTRKPANAGGTASERATPEADPLAEFFYQSGESAPETALLAAAPEADRTDAAEETRTLESEYLSFHLGDEMYALPISALREIVRPLPITDVPRTPKWVVGVVTLRGTVLPVLDLRVRLGLQVREPGRTARILIVETDEGPAGLVADRIGGVVRDEGGTLEPPPQALGTATDFIAGLLRRDGRMMIVLNYGAALRIGERDRPGRETA